MTLFFLHVLKNLFIKHDGIYKKLSTSEVSYKSISERIDQRLKKFKNIHEFCTTTV